MADDVDTESDDEIECSGMIQPPLIKQLQTILSEYPDDGQILKVDIQQFIELSLFILLFRTSF